MGSTLRKRTTAGMANKCGIRRLASIWFSVVVPSQTFAQVFGQITDKLARDVVARILALVDESREADPDLCEFSWRSCRVR